MPTVTAEPAALPAPFDAPPDPNGLVAHPATVELVRSQVRAVLQSTPAYHALPAPDRQRLEANMTRVAAYSAELLRDDWLQSARLGQRPVARRREQLAGPAAEALASSDDFAPAAADQIARVTRETLEAISFPEFVADLIRGSFNAIVNSSIQQMEAYTELLENVSKTVEQFESDNITDNQARDWLAQRYPRHVQIAPGEPRLQPAPTADEAGDPRWREALALPDDVDPTDDAALEEVLVPAARRKLAQSRLQTLSMLVLMGINRIIVTGGKVRASMAFHIDTTDRAREQRATDFDFRTSASGSVGFGAWSAAASMSMGYVQSQRAQSETELNVAADLTGEVEIHFRSDVFPLERFVDQGGAESIRSNTPVPAANPPPWGDSPATRAEVRRVEAVDPMAPRERVAPEFIQAPQLAPPGQRQQPAQQQPAQQQPAQQQPAQQQPAAERPAAASPPAAAAPANPPAAAAPANPPAAAAPSGEART